MNWQSREDERVARALEGAPLHGREDRGMVALAERIREVPAATGLDAAPDFRAALRARVLAEGATLLPRPRTPAEATPDSPDVPTPAGAPSAGGPGSTRPPRARHAQSPPNRPAGRRLRHRKTFATTMLVIATLSATTVAASGDALPGDPLYGLKRKVQSVEMIVARSDVDRGHRHLELARIRVRELNTAGVSASPGPLLSTLDDMDTETRTGIRLLSTAAVDDTDEAELGELAAWTAQQRGLLAAAAGRLPEGVRARAARSLALLATVAARIEELRASLRCDCPPATGPDDLGPQPCLADRCRTTTSAPSAPPPVQTRTTPAPGTTPPSRGAPAPSWPPGRPGTAPPGRAPSASGSPAPPVDPSWPNPEPPVVSTSPTAPPPEPTASAEPSPSPEPAAPQSVPDVVTGILGSLVGVPGRPE